MTDEEIERLNKVYSIERIKAEFEQIRKETAKEIIKWLMDEQNVYETTPYKTYIFTKQDIEELAEKYDIEVK